MVIPTFNRRELLLEALASVEAQTLRPAEVIVVDDGSSDGTREMLESMGGRVRPLFQSNAGAAAARNHGIEAAKGDWIAFLDSHLGWVPPSVRPGKTARLPDSCSTPCNRSASGIVNPHTNPTLVVSDRNRG